jgi:hypothetical protein
MSAHLMNELNWFFVDFWMEFQLLFISLFKFRLLLLDFSLPVFFVLLKATQHHFITLIESSGCKIGLIQSRCAKSFVMAVFLQGWLNFLLKIFVVESSWRCWGMIERFILNLIALKSLIILSLSVNIFNGSWMRLVRVILTDCRLM